MIFVSIKLFATDLDGTLLNKNGEISPANKQAIKEMAKKVLYQQLQQVECMRPLVDLLNN